MSYWIELHCDIRAPGYDLKHPTLLGCETQRGDSLGQMTTSKATAGMAFKRLHVQARRFGWKPTPNGWACPFCAAKQKA